MIQLIHGKLEGARLPSYCRMSQLQLPPLPHTSAAGAGTVEPSLFLPSSWTSRNSPSSRSVEPTSATYRTAFSSFTFMPLLVQFVLNNICYERSNWIAAADLL